jgi:hypothetical protein
MVTAGTPANAAVEAVVRALIAISPEGRAASRRRQPAPADRGDRIGTWAFFTNHMALLIAIARAPALTVRELAVLTKLTERGTLSILGQLEAEGIITRHREGRRNRYTIDLEAFRKFRGWSFRTWAIPDQLIDVARKGIRAVGRG